MRKTFISLLLLVLSTVTTFAGKEELYVLYEGFENGIPATWSQINEAGQQMWITESATDAQYPDGVVAGEYRAAFRNTTTQTQHFVTKLVTPVFDISKTVHPILSFEHAQAQRTADVDELRVYYRASENDRWVLLKEYVNKFTKWTNETIDLPGATTTYQLAFEATDNLGRGVVLDEIIVRPAPTCENPFNISTDGLSTNSATLRWNGSLDTETFRVILSTKHITNIEEPEGIVYDSLIADFSVAIDKLNRNTTYYVYIQAQCGVENSDWSDEFSFTTKNLVDVPYVETFNKDYASGTISHPSYWTCGTSIKKDDGSMEYMPFINQQSSDTERKNYSFSNTTCLVFSGARNMSKLIPAGEYVYGATPELNVASVKDVQATFWGTCHTYYSETNANGLIVGVMTDPADWTTFVAVDTVYIKGAQLFDRFTVYFDNYVGEGKYIAFASNFVDKDNIFFMDDLEIKTVTGVKMPTNVSLFNTTAKSVSVNANMNGESASKIYVTKHVIDAKTGQVQLDPLAESFGAENILATYEVTSFPYTAVLPETANGMFVQVYVQNVNGQNFSDFALPEKQLVPKHWVDTTGMLVNFDDVDTDKNWSSNQLKNFWNNSSSYNYPYEMITDFMTQPGLSSSSTVYTVRYPLLGGTTAASKYHSKGGAVYLKRDRRVFGDGTEWIMPHGQYMALPEVDDLSTFFLQFYLASYSDSHPEAAGVIVGAMTDPFDITTFDTITTVTCGNDWKMAIVSFADYKGQGHFPAIMAATMLTDESWAGGSGSSSGSSYKDYYMSATWIDDVQYLKAGGCMPATDLKAEVSYDQATLTWNANNMEQWIVTVYADEAKKDTLESDTITVPTYMVKELKPHTLYYYDVVALCGGKEFPADPATFTTECLPAEKIPYVEDFEAYDSGSTTHIVPACWNVMQQKVYYPGGSSGEPSTSWYPYVGSSTYAHTGTKGYYFQYYKKTSGYTITPLMDDQPSFIALPLMAEELNKLQMTFWMKAGGVSYVGDTVYVGVMSDPTDLATFDTIQLVKTTKDYSENIVRFNNYTGQGKYIAFLKTPRELARACYLDDIKVDYLAECEKVQGVSAANFDEDGAVISWTKGDATQWEIVVATKELTADEIAGKDAAIVKDSITTENPFVVDYCPETNTEYFVYVRALCSETNKGDWSNAISFKTTCVSKTAGGYGFIDFAEDDFKTAEFPCWNVGRREGTTAVPSITVGSHLYMFNTTASEGAYAIMPPIDVDSINRLQVKFTASGGTGAAYLRELTVGIISNPSDLSTFQPIETVKLPKAVTTISKANHAKNLDEAQTFIVRFNEYAGDYEGNFGKQIMFLSENGGVANYVYIYSMQVDTIPSCWEPIKVEEVEVNTYDATMGWDTVGTSYQVQLLAEDKQTVLVDSLTDKQQMKFEGLTMLTKYYVRVRTICAVGDTSAWSPMGNFTTQCPVAYPVPYEQNFDDYASGGANFPDCWERFCNYTGTTTTYQPYINSSAKKDGKNGMQMYGSTSYYSYAVLPPMADKLSNLMLEFDYRSNSTSYAMTMVVGVATDVTSLEGLDTTFVPLDTITADKWVAANANWYHYAQSFDDYTGEGQIVFYSPKFPSSSNGYAYLDNIYVSKTPTCFRPIEPTFASATASSVTLTWTPQGNETAWDIACLLAGEEDITKATITTVSGEGPKGTVTGLTDATEYNFYVRANCGEGDFSEWSSMVSATTLCVVPAAEANWNFDDYTTRVLNPNAGNSTSYMIEQCWLAKSTSTSASSQPYLNKNAYSTTTGTYSSRYAYTDTCALKFYSTATAPAIAVLPELVADLDTMQISFVGRSVYESYGTSGATAGKFTKYYNTYATGTYARSIKVGTVTDPYDMSTFEELVDYQFAEVTAENCSTKVEGDYWEPVTVSLYGAQGKYIAFLSEYDATNYAWIDNVKVETESGLNMPTAIKLNEETFTGEHADLTWRSRATKFEVVVTDMTDTTVILKDTIDVAALTLDNLTMLTNYVVSIKAMNAEMTESSAPAVFKFKTPCMPYDQTNAKWDFSKESATYAYTTLSATPKIPECWEAGQLTKALATSYTYMPQVKVSTANTYTYGRLDDATDGALQFYNYSNTYGDSYAVLPELNVNYDSTALHFWIRAAYFWPQGAAVATNKKKIREANTNYPKDLLIGTVSDMSDMTTFVQQDMVTYPYDLAANIYAYNDETGNDYWVEVILPLKKYKDQGRIVLYYPLGQKTGYMFIDDLEVIDADFCTPITNINANVTALSADVTWSFTGKDSVQLQMATTEEFSDKTIFVDSIMSDANGLFQITTLDSGTDYYVRMMHFCSEEEASDWTAPYNFTTLFNVRFNEQFNAVCTYPKHWKRANSKIVDVLDNGVTPAPVSDDISANWVRDPNTADMTVTTGSGNGTSSSITYYNYWLLTPTITLADVDKADKLMLSFDLFLTDNSGNQPFNQPSEFDQFIVVISTDGGKTFPRANATIWNAAGTDRKYSDITGKPTKQMVDLSQYIGQDIVIAFAHDAHSELDKPCSKNYMHLDNVQVNTYVENMYGESICQFNDFEDDNFFIDADELIVGEITTYTKFDPAKKNGENDIFTQLNLTVNAATTTENSVSVCEGSKIEMYNFVIENVAKSDVYKQKFESIDGCDSISVLNVTVLPISESKVEATICQGDYYEFNGVKYYTNTTHSDTLSSLVTGCDSIVTLYLTVNAILEGSAEEHLCPGDSVFFGKYGWIKQAGTYTDTVKTDIGCDSLATLIVYQHENASTRIQGAIIKGDSYSDGVFEGLTQPGNYPSKQQTVYGCDSIVTLHLMVANDESEILYDTISVDQLPYILNGEILLPEDTPMGVYSKSVPYKSGALQLVIIVGTSTGWENVYVDPKNGAAKVIKDEHFYIIHNNVWRDATGRRIR